MLSILAPRSKNPERTCDYPCHAPRRQSFSTADIQNPKRTFSLGSGRRRTRDFTDLKSAAAPAVDATTHIPAQPTTSAAGSRKLHVPAWSTPVSRTVPNRSDSIASCRTLAPSSYGSWKVQDNDIPHLTKTPWEVERYKRNSAWKRSAPETELPARAFKHLPREVYDCIVAQLEQIHLQKDQACPSCYLKDLYSLALTSRAWDKAATMQMYRKVYIIGYERPSQLAKIKTKGPSRLKLLRRTLRERQLMARHVRELHLPDFQSLYQEASIEREEIVNLVASLVMACPSLERLVGFHIPFTQSFDRLSYALATRPKLRERVWLLSALEDDDLGEEDDDEVNRCYFAARDPTERFLDLNSRHPLLTTLVLHRASDGLAPALNFRAIIGTFRQLPALQHLSISGLPASSFTNLALNALPPRLRSLRLENLPGINDKGLQRYVTSHSSTSIESLTLINLEISSLITITSILSDRMSKLKRFTITQYRTPDLGPRLSIPDFSCRSLLFIHFEFRSQSGPSIDPFSPDSRKSVDFPFSNPEPISCLATSLLAMNIKEGAFPALRRARIPHDPQGLIQALCKPCATALLPADSSLFTGPLQNCGSHGYATRVDAHAPQSQSTKYRESWCATPLSLRADSAIESQSFSNSSCSSVLTPSKTRLAAQARIIAARKDAIVTVRVYDPEGDIRIDTAIGGFIGDIKSKIVYDLKPDASRWPGNLDQSGPPQPEWTTGIEDLVDERPHLNDRSRERFRGDCGHLIGGRTGKNTVRVEQLF